MKIKRREISILLVLLMFVFSLTLTSACNFNANLLNQDPYPAVPGETVKIVFQVTGIENRDCGEVRLKVLEEFPFNVDPSMSAIRSIQSGVYVRDYQNFWMVPFILRVDKDAKEGDNKLEIELSRVGSTGGLLQTFEINVKDVTTDFEISVRNYNPSTKRITFEILNSGKNDVDALTVELKRQEGVTLRGSLISTIGSLDSNDFATTDFDAVAEKGDIKLMLYYTDEIGVRRSVEETVYFDPQPFILKANANGGISTVTYVIIVFLIIGIAYFFYRRHKKKQAKRKLSHNR